VSSFSAAAHRALHRGQDSRLPEHSGTNTALRSIDSGEMQAQLCTPVFRGRYGNGPARQYFRENAGAALYTSTSRKTQTQPRTAVLQGKYRRVHSMLQGKAQAHFAQSYIREDTEVPEIPQTNTVELYTLFALWQRAEMQSCPSTNRRARHHEPAEMLTCWNV
jgi:hypothetical protein